MTIDNDYEDKFVDVYLYSNNIYDDSEVTITSEKKIEIYLEDDYVKGIKVDISNLWNNELDTELGELIIFPENVTANDNIQQLQEKYKTGILNLYLREWEEYLSDGTYLSSLNYSGEYYNISIDLLDEKIQSIFYYYNK